MGFNVTVDSNNVLGTSVNESGKYNVRVLDTSEFKQTSTGKEMAVLNYEVLDGPYAGGQIRYDNVVWDESSPEAVQRSERSFNTILVAAGVDDGVKVDSMLKFVKGLVGKTLSVTTEWSEFNGKVNLNVTQHNEPDVDGNKPSGITRDDFQAKNGGQQRNNQSQQGDLNPFQSKQNDPFGTGGEINISDDDLPF